ncbi:MAG: hypothetical protein ACE5DS_01455, partial [Kiloniellaceae bacterium]
ERLQETYERNPSHRIGIRPYGAGGVSWGSMLGFPEILNLISDVLEQYWLVPVGVVVLFIYGLVHFNTPDYPLTSEQDRSDSENEILLPKDHPLAQPHTLAPPIYTTLRGRYLRQAAIYVGGLELAFLVVNLFPDLVAKGFALQGILGMVPENAQERAIWTLFVLMGMLPSFPGIRRADRLILAYLHKRAVIPTEASQHASKLFEASFHPEQGVVDDVVASMGHARLRDLDYEKETIGRLERAWFKASCLMNQLNSRWGGDQSGSFQSRFAPEFDEIKRAYRFQTKKVSDCKAAEEIRIPMEGESAAGSSHANGETESTNLATLIPENVENVDTYIHENQSGFPEQEHHFQDLSARREKLAIKVEALFYRMCLSMSLLAFATETRSDDIERMYRVLGFNVRIPDLPRLRLTIVLQTGAALFLVVFLPSALYAIAVGELPKVGITVEIPQDYSHLVPKDWVQVVYWSLATVVLHGSALVLAVWIKRRSARKYAARHPSTGAAEYAASNQARRNNGTIALVCFVLGYVVGVTLSWLIMPPDKFSFFFPWALLTAGTGYFVALYIDRDLSGIPPGYRLMVMQGLVFAGLAFPISLISVTQGFGVTEWKPFVWIFTIYATLTVSLIGLSIGFVFPRAYRERAAHEEPPTAEVNAAANVAEATPHVAEGTG